MLHIPIQGPFYENNVHQWFHLMVLEKIENVFLEWFCRRQVWKKWTVNGKLLYHYAYDLNYMNLMGLPMKVITWWCLIYIGSKCKWVQLLKAAPTQISKPYSSSTMHSHPAPAPTSKTLSYPPYAPHIPRRQVQRNLYHAGVYPSPCFMLTWTYPRL